MENQRKKLRLDEVKVESFVTSQMVKFDTKTPRGGGSDGNSDLRSYPIDECGFGGEFCPCTNEPYGCPGASEPLNGAPCVIYPPVVVYPQPGPNSTQLVCQNYCNGGGGTDSRTGVFAFCYCAPNPL